MGDMREFSKQLLVGREKKRMWNASDAGKLRFYSKRSLTHSISLSMCGLVFFLPKIFIITAKGIQHRMKLIAVVNEFLASAMESDGNFFGEIFSFMFIERILNFSKGFKEEEGKIYLRLFSSIWEYSSFQFKVFGNFF